MATEVRFNVNIPKVVRWYRFEGARGQETAGDEQGYQVAHQSFTASPPWTGSLLPARRVSDFSAPGFSGSLLLTEGGF